VAGIDAGRDRPRVRVPGGPLRRSIPDGVRVLHRLASATLLAIKPWGQGRGRQLEANAPRPGKLSPRPRAHSAHRLPEGSAPKMRRSAAPVGPWSAPGGRCPRRGAAAVLSLPGPSRTGTVPLSHRSHVGRSPALAAERFAISRNAAATGGAPLTAGWRGRERFGASLPHGRWRGQALRPRAARRPGPRPGGSRAEVGAPGRGVLRPRLGAGG
jgi:hypothetical protein